MARYAIQGTFSASGAHGAAHIADPSTTGDVVLAFDNTKITTRSALRAVVLALLAAIDGTNHIANP